MEIVYTYCTAEPCKQNKVVEAPQQLMLAVGFTLTGGIGSAVTEGVFVAIGGPATVSILDDDGKSGNDCCPAANSLT